MAQAVLQEAVASTAFQSDRRPFQVDPVDQRVAAMVRRELWRAPARQATSDGPGFERVWTALLLGALVGAPIALVIATGMSLLLPGSDMLYLEMTSVFFIGWTLGTLACLAGRETRVQWEIALWLGAGALLMLAGCYLALPRGDAVAAVDTTLAALLAATARLLPEWLPTR